MILLGVASLRRNTVDRGKARVCYSGETLESVSSCTRFSGILKISTFGFNRSSSKLVGMFFYYYLLLYLG